MSTAAVIVPTPFTGYRVYRAVVVAEARLWLREPMSVFWILLFPSVLVAIIGLVPAFQEDDPALGGRAVIDLYVPIAVSAAIALAGLSALPGPLSTYRARGYLRRLDTTPVGAGPLLASQLIINAAACVGSAVVCLVVGRLVHGVPLPANPLAFGLGLALGIAALLGLGLVIAAVARTPVVAGIVGNLLIFPLMFFAGLWVPLQALPEWLRTVAEATPLGAAVTVMDQASIGDWPAWQPAVVLVCWAVGAAVAARRLFTWR